MDTIIDPNILSDDVFDNEGARNCLMNMGLTAENVAEKFKISFSLKWWLKVTRLSHGLKSDYF